VLIDEDLTRTVIGSFYKVVNTLGSGLPEAPYVAALAHECAKRGLQVDCEFPIAVHYDGIIVGSYRADLLIEHRLIVEAKACPIVEEHRKQLLTYLRCSRVELGLLLSFDVKPVVKRFIFRNSLKGLLL
jgi:GxxExxY protein